MPPRTLTAVERHDREPPPRCRGGNGLALRSWHRAASAGIGAIAQGVRLWLWDPVSTVREPLLWILPLSYAWLPVSLVLRALWLADTGVPVAPSLHALGIVAMGGLMLGMMTRSALGHTGRPLAAGTVETASYVLVHLAAAVRVFVPLAEPGAASLAAGVSSLLWTAAFAIFLAAYWPVLTRPRVDERPIRKEPANRTAE